MRDIDEVAEEVCEPLLKHNVTGQRVQAQMLANIKKVLFQEREEARKQAAQECREIVEKLMDPWSTMNAIAEKFGLLERVAEPGGEEMEEAG